jgi:hypothetical protein
VDKMMKYLIDRYDITIVSLALLVNVDSLHVALCTSVKEVEQIEKKFFDALDMQIQTENQLDRVQDEVDK